MSYWTRILCVTLSELLQNKCVMCEGRRNRKIVWKIRLRVAHFYYFCIYIYWNVFKLKITLIKICLGSVTWCSVFYKLSICWFSWKNLVTFPKKAKGTYYRSFFFFSWESRTHYKATGCKNIFGCFYLMCSRSTWEGNKKLQSPSLFFPAILHFLCITLILSAIQEIWSHIHKSWVCKNVPEKVVRKM